MSEYKRTYVPGASYFFTVNLANRKQSLLVDHVDELRLAFKTVKKKWPFSIDAIVILPEHLHSVWTLPLNDSDYSSRWRLIKSQFSRSLPLGEKNTISRILKGERGVWQRGYWEHLIRDERDYQQHIQYIHYNPVKHGCCEAVVDWPYSSFHRFVERGYYTKDWGKNLKNITTEYGE
ncbi:MAG: transposase [Pseudomonadales bacterium]|nr:transposase [Pseudomonadales bacterium]